MSRIESLKQIMYAKSIAVIGASNKPASVGNETMKRLTEFGFKGDIYPVNLKEEFIEGVKCYKSILDIKKQIDFALIAVPSAIVSSVIDECHEANIQNVVIITAGFKEIGGEGSVLEKEIDDKIKKYNMSMIGPNCLGVMNCVNNMNATFNPVAPISGKIGFATQSGAIGCGIINLLKKKSFGLNQMISLGNQSDLTFLDIVEFWEKDDNIEIIMLYIEGIPDAKKFREVCTRVSKTKPIIMLKAGRSEVGGKATASHTGSLAGDDLSLNAVIESSGVIRELYLRDLINTVQVFSNCPIPKGKNLGVLTNAGGPGIITVDSASDYDLGIAKLSDETKAKLTEILPHQASVKNPVDMIASASLDNYMQSAKILLDSPEVDILVVIYLYITVKNDINLIKSLEVLKKQYPNKPIIAVFQTSKSFSLEFDKLDTTIPVYNFAIDAIYSINKLLDRKKYLERIETEKTKIYPVKKEMAENLIKKSQSKLVSTYQSLEIFKSYDLPLPKYALAKNLEKAKSSAKEIGYPIVLKISSLTISHKSDIGGVVTNILNEEQLIEEWNLLFKRLEKANAVKDLEGVVVMEQVKQSQREFVAGIVEKESVGKLEMFGLGGIFVEALKEVKFRPCPLTAIDANDLLTKTKACKLLGDIRGYKGCDLEKMQEVLMRLSQLATDFEVIKEIDVNPIMLDKNGNIFVVDARIVLK